MYLRAGHAEAFLQIFFVADQNIDVGHDAPKDFARMGRAAGEIPDLFAIVEIERDNSAGGFRCLRGFDDELRVVGESAAKMPPEWNQRTPEAKMAFQSKSPGFKRAAASLDRL